MENQFIFYKGLDSYGNDTSYVGPKPVNELMKICLESNTIVGFNTLGYMKHHIVNVADFIHYAFYGDNGGLYVSKKDRFRVKMICNWCNSKLLCDDWNRMSQGNYRWNDIEITDSDIDIDFYVIVNKPMGDEYYVPERTIVLQMEPWCYDETQHWGVKTWGMWANPDKANFLQVRSHDTYLNTTFWQLKTTYSEFKTMGNIKKDKIISTICSSKYFDPGHIKRIDFIKFIESKNDSNVQIHMYNHDNYHNFNHYKGPHPSGNKDVAILPYKYYFMMENNAEKNFITEKIWEPLLCECLCFYWGCPNITDWINPETFILLDINDFEKSYDIMKSAIENDEWSKRIDAIRLEKQKVLDYYNFFPTLERIIKNEFKFNYHPSDDQIIYHKYFNHIINTHIDNICFIHNKNPSVLDEMITCILPYVNIIYVVNIGNPIVYQHDKVQIINYSDNMTLTENVTINLVHIFSKLHSLCNVLYLHTADIGVPWRKYLLDMLVNDTSIALLNMYDTVGCNYTLSPYKHYVHNFWWAKSDYIKRLEMENYEWFILSNSDVNYYNFGNMDPISDYEMIIPKLYLFNDNIRIKCVNLLRRPDRKETTIDILKHTSLLPYTDFYEAIDGKKLIVTDDILKLFNNNDFNNKRGVIGCALSHYYLWKQLIEDEYGMYLIIEDDIVIVDKFIFKMNMILDKLKDTKWDIIYFGYHERNTIIGDKMEIITYDTTNNIGGTFGYLINKGGANKILQFIDIHGIKHGIDYLMFHYHQEMNLIQYQITPQMIISEFVSSNNIVDSDIQYDHDKLF